MRIQDPRAVSLVLAFLLLGLAAPAVASGPGGILSGGVFEEVFGAPSPFPIYANGGEFFAVKVRRPAGASRADWVYDLGPGRDKTPSTVAGDDGSYFSLPGNFTLLERDSDVFFVILTFSSGRVALDSATLGSGGAAGFTHPQLLGNSPRVGQLDGTGLVLTPEGTSVPGIANRGAGPGTFPYGTRSSIEFAFAPLIDVNNVDVTGGADWAWGGISPDPDRTDGHGIVQGYNVYRMARDTEPTRAELGAVANFQYFIDFDQFDLTRVDGQGGTGADRNGDGLPDGDDTDAPRDGAADTDLAGLVNPRVGPFTSTGDEVVIFSDARMNPNGSPRTVGTGPLPGVAYWYAVQPVVRGSIADFTFASITERPPADLRVDVDVDGIMDAVNLDIGADPTASSLEFISPQARFGLPGLGLTNAGHPVLSQPVRGIMNAAAAVGAVGVEAEFVDGVVHVRWSAGLETADVLGYAVVRFDGQGAVSSGSLGDGTRVKIHGGLVLARGGEGNAYAVTDETPRWSRGRSARRFDGPTLYGVEVYHDDGSAPTFVGPVEVRSLPRRRQ